MLISRNPLTKPGRHDRRASLQVLEDGGGIRDLKGVHLLLTGSVGDLAVVEDDGVAAGAALGVGPADALGEPGPGVGEEELQSVSGMNPSKAGGEPRTMSSPVTWLALPQALMTKGSLNAVTATTSTPLARSSGSFSRYSGTWRAEQTGVKAPGRAKRTTFLLAQSLEAW